MSEREINIAIAEARGWEPLPEGHFHPDNPLGQTMPNYCNDLNAMHEAENKLTPFQRIKHGHFLQEILNEAVVGFVSNYESELKSLSRVASAPARQRAEAFLRTLGKWEETK